ncbi:MAG: hypothetical protein K0U34_03450, partial [Alphaproteobacteria bacterium]|nr:hypothetical protein [Alphaproteobacteria bacterium]
HALGGPGSLLDFVSQKPETLSVFAATFPSAQITVPYESTTKLIDAGVSVVKDLPPHVVYVLAVLTLAAGATGDVLVAKLKAWLF